MRLMFAALLVVHGLIHLAAAAKGFKMAAPLALTQSISPGAGLLWLAASGLLLATAGALFTWPRWWWAIGVAAVIVSQTAIATSWVDAKAGTIPNLVVLVGVLFGFLAYGPGSLRATYEDVVDQGLLAPGSAGLVTEADLERVPAPVARYLGVSGVVGRPRVHNMHVSMHGRIRSNADAPWMPFRAEQYNFFDRPARLFYMNGSRQFVPFQGLHRYDGREASMRVKVAALIVVANAAGRDMTRAETVTMFNDMCMLAPATLIDPAITWGSSSGSTVRATFSNAGHAIQADLEFNPSGELVNFRSTDRGQAQTDGTAMRQLPWSTPLGAYRSFGDFRLSGSGEARWQEPGGEYAYVQIEIDEVRYNVRSR